MLPPVPAHSLIVTLPRWSRRGRVLWSGSVLADQPDEHANHSRRLVSWPKTAPYVATDRVAGSRPQFPVSGPPLPNAIYQVPVVANQSPSVVPLSSLRVETSRRSTRRSAALTEKHLGDGLSRARNGNKRQ